MLPDPRSRRSQLNLTTTFSNPAPRVAYQVTAFQQVKLSPGAKALVLK